MRARLGRRGAWPSLPAWKQETGGSNPPALTNLLPVSAFVAVYIILINGNKFTAYCSAFAASYPSGLFSASQPSM